MENRLKDRRLELGLTLEEVGDIVGVGKSTVRKWENGIIENMKRDKIVLLAKALKVSPVFVMNAEEDESYSLVKRITNVSERLSDDRKEKVYNFAEHQLEEQNKIVEFPEKINVLGQTAAGSPVDYGDPDIEEKEFKSVPKGAQYALNVKGDSMEPLIKDGSIVFYKEQPNVESGEIAIVEVDGDGVTCKKVKLDYDHDKIILQSLNNKYDDLELEGNQVRIIGKVVL